MKTSTGRFVAGFWNARRNQIDEPFDGSLSAVREHAGVTACINQRD